MDALTGVLNRRGLQQALEREMALFRRYGAGFTVAMLDLDEFERLNDRHGHVAGDEIVVWVARLLRQGLRETDVVAGFGGNKFLLLLPHTSARESATIPGKLRQGAREHIGWLPDDHVCATASFGASNTRGRRSLSAHDLPCEADEAPGRIKHLGRDPVGFFAAAETAYGPSRSIVDFRPIRGISDKAAVRDGRRTTLRSRRILRWNPPQTRRNRNVDEPSASALGRHLDKGESRRDGAILKS
ncbi:MAG TPA: GGDEF domain-containing protein [Acidobacteriaceae bacterium]|nr:GGDEF domain-containing protein [Acidobacteriaceae bacterium]